MTATTTAPVHAPGTRHSVDLNPSDTFVHRHLGPREHELLEMLRVAGYASLEALTDATVPAGIRRQGLMHLEGLPTDRTLGEHEVLGLLRTIADQNTIAKSYIGMGYYDTITPGVILRNILENPGWYTQYTPYQAEIAQGRLEALLNFQTMVADLTGLPLAGASLLDEGTAAAEAMAARTGRCSSSPRTAIRRRSRSVARVPSRWASSSAWFVPRPISPLRACAGFWCSIRTPPARSPTTAP